MTTPSDEEKPEKPSRLKFAWRFMLWMLSPRDIGAADLAIVFLCIVVSIQPQPTGALVLVQVVCIAILSHLRSREKVMRQIPEMVQAMVNEVLGAMQRDGIIEVRQPQHDAKPGVH